MKLKLALPDLIDALNSVRDTIGTDSHGHEGIRIYASKKTGRIKLTTTDGSFTTEKWLTGTVVEGGKAIVKGKRFADYVKRLDVKTCDLSVKDNGGILLKTTRGQQTFLSFDESQFQMPPKLKTLFTLNLSGRVYKQMINSVAFAADDSKNPNVPVIQGVHFYSDGTNLEISATNGHTVANLVRKMKTQPIDVVLGRKALIMSARGLQDDDKVVIQGCERNRFIIKVGDATYHLPTLAGTFPNIRTILPKRDFKLEFTVDRDELLGVLNRASTMLENKALLNFSNGKVTISGKTQGDEFSEYLKTTLKGKANDVTVDVKQMINIVKSIESEILQIGVRDLKPIAFRPEGKYSHTCVLAVG